MTEEEKKIKELRRQVEEARQAQNKWLEEQNKKKKKKKK